VTLRERWAGLRERLAERRYGPEVEVGGEALGRLRPGVVPHNAKHCDTDPACPLHRPTETLYAICRSSMAAGST
jgi:hypothetical protein